MAEDSSEIVREAMEGVAGVDVLVKGNGPAYLSNILYANAVSNQHAIDAQRLQAMTGMNQIAQAVVGKVTEMIISTSPGEGGADTAALAALAKIIQGTPPPTNIPTQGQ